MDVKSIESAVEENYNGMVQLRRHLHMYPELSFKEVHTPAYIADYLRSLSIDVREGVGDRQAVDVSAVESLFQAGFLLGDAVLDLEGLRGRKVGKDAGVEAERDGADADEDETAEHLLDRLARAEAAFHGGEHPAADE